MARLKANEEKENEEKKAVSEERPQPVAEMNSKEKKEKEEKKAESEERPQPTARPQSAAKFDVTIFQPTLCHSGLLGRHAHSKSTLFSMANTRPLPALFLAIHVIALRRLAAIGGCTL